MKLTAAIVMSYPNAQVRHIDREYDVCAIYKGNDTIDVIHDKNGIRSYGALRIYQCQLILTPLSKISDEDAVEVAKIMGIKLDTPNSILKIKQCLTEKEYYWIDFGDSEGRAIASAILNYLRSKSYDIDNLIAAGVAVEKTNL